jgi:hypothetical protein
MRSLASVVFACTLLVGSGSAQDYQPYPDARITEAQWQSYFQQVKEKFGSSEVHPSANLVEFHSSDTLYVFTEPGHAAHPAWVTQQIVKVDGGLGMRQVGYFAGEEAAFAMLFQAYQGRIAKVKEDMNRRSQGPERQIGVVAPMGAAGRFEASALIFDEINVTTDSRPGWTPTADQRQHVIKAVQAFLDAVESGRYTEAYGLQAEVNQRRQTLAQFTQDAQKFQALAGRLKYWRVVKVTWTKDSARAPFPGIYAAVDLIGQFASVDRDCGFMVLFQPSSGGDFAILRRENNYLDNATARTIEEKQSKSEVTKVWGQLSRHCPGYVSSLESP